MEDSALTWFEKFRKTGRIPLKTLEEAEVACREYREGTEEYHLALSVWIRFSLKEVEAAKTASDAFMAHSRSPRKTFAERRARDKWDALTTSEAYLARTYEQACHIYRVARYLSRAEEIAREVKFAFGVQKINKARTLQDFKRLDELITGGREKELLVKSWKQAVLKALKEADSCEEVLSVFELCPKIESLLDVVMLRMDDLYQGERKGESVIHFPDGETGFLYNSKRHEIRESYPEIFMQSE